MNGSSPHRNPPPPPENDIEAGPLSRRNSDVDDDGDVFDIARTKHASIDRLRRWRVSFLFFLSHTCRFFFALFSLSLYVCLILNCFRCDFGYFRSDFYFRKI